MNKKISRIFGVIMALLMVTPFLAPLKTAFADVGAGHAGSGSGVHGDYTGFIEWYDDFDSKRNPNNY